MADWIDVNERLPEEETRVLVALADGTNSYTLIDTDRRKNGRWVRWHSYVTHWQPLPELPRKRGEGDDIYRDYKGFGKRYGFD